MENNSRKIGLGSFIGGAVTAIVVMLLAAKLGFNWAVRLGLVAGSISGYFFYDIVEVIRATPQACRVTIPAVYRAFCWLADQFRRPKLFTPYVIVITVSLVSVVIYYQFYQMAGLGLDDFSAAAFIYFWVCCVVYLAGMLVAIFSLDSSRVRARWGDRPGDILYQANGITGISLTWGEYFLLVGATIYGLLGIPLWIGRGIYRSPGCLWHFGRYLFRLIHSTGRVVCAFYGPVGGLLAVVIANQGGAMRLFDTAILGGLFGCVLGLTMAWAYRQIAKTNNEIIAS